jgi:SlyX protein
MTTDTGATGAQPVDTPLPAGARVSTSADLVPVSVEQWREMSAHLVELQTQLAFQEDTLQALDDVVTSQQQSIDRLMQLQRRLERQLAELAGTDESAPADERPPHY